MGSGKARAFELLESERIDAPYGKAARAISGEIRFAFLIENGFGYDGTGGIAGAKKRTL